MLRRSLERGWRYGLASGLGVALADASYAALAAVGVGAAVALLSGQRRWFELAGGAALVGLGVAGLRTRRASEAPAPPSPAGLVAALATIYLLTIANPATIVSFAALFAGPGQSLAGGRSPALLVLGVLLGSFAWWIVLNALAAWLRARLDQRAVRVLRAGSGLAIAAFGLLALLVAARA